MTINVIERISLARRSAFSINREIAVLCSRFLHDCFHLPTRRIGRPLGLQGGYRCLHRIVPSRWLPRLR